MEDQRIEFVDLRPYLFGGVASCVAEIVTFPIDTTKTRLQLQGQVIDPRFTKLKYRGMAHCLCRVVKDEGITSVYRGLAPAVVRQAVYGTIKYGLYYSVKDLLSDVFNLQRESHLLNLGCAIFAGSISSAIATPTDVIKIRMQARTVKPGSTMLGVARDIYTKEGVSGLYRGVCPTAQRCALVAGVQLPVYDWCKAVLVKHVFQDGAVCHLCSSLVAGLAAAIASNPIDVIRTRLMYQRNLLSTQPGHGQYQIYQSSLQCGLNTIRTEGVAALYKGFIPAFSRMGPWNIVFFLVYEKLKILRF